MRGPLCSTYIVDRNLKILFPNNEIQDGYYLISNVGILLRNIPTGISKCGIYTRPDAAVL